MFGKLKKQIEKLKRQHGVLVYRNREAQRELKEYKQAWEPVADFMRERNQNNICLTMPEKIIEYIEYLEHVANKK